MGHHLGEFEQLLLFAILRLRDGAYGVAIRREIEGRTGRGISVGAVYTTLHRLEERGFVSARVGEPTAERGGRRKKYYALESAGATALNRSYQNLRAMAKGLAPRLEQLAQQMGMD